MSDVRTPIASPGGRVVPAGTTRIVAAGLVVLAVVVVATGWWFATRNGPHGDPALYEHRWTVESASIDGEAVDTTAVRWVFGVLLNDGDPSFSDRPHISVTDGCGHWSNQLDIDDSTGSNWAWRPARSAVDTRPGVSTWCYGEILEVMDVLVGAGSFDYVATDDRVHITSSDLRAEITLLAQPEDG